MGAVVAALAGCGGGSDDGVDNSAMTLNVNPSVNQNLPANSSLTLTMNSSVRRASSTDTASIASLTWTLTPLNGETINPVLSDAACAGMNSSGASAGCSTLLSIPQTVTTGKWTVLATAKASNGTQRSESFTLSVDNTVYSLNAGPAQTIVAATNGTFAPVTLTGVLSGANGGKVVSTTWVQTEGPVAAVLANANTLTPSFVPTVTGKYTFNLRMVVDSVTLNAVTTVDAQPN